MDNLEIEKVNKIQNNNQEENNNDTMLENQSRKIEYINIYWDEWNM